MMVPTRTRSLTDPRNGPIVLRGELLALGETDKSIARMLRDGTLVRVRHGAYASAEAWATLDVAGRFGLRGRAVLRQARTPCALYHVSGLPEYGAPTWGFDLSEVHVTRTDALPGRKEAGVCQHRGLVRSGDLAEVNGVPVMSPERIALETVIHGNSEASLCVMNDLLHRNLTSIDALNAQYVDMANWPGMRAAEILLRLADPRIESVGETRTLYCCFRQGLPMPTPQVEIVDGSGQVVARVDFAWPELGVFLEFDGRVKYEKLLRDGERASDVVIREKQREELVCRLTGWRCIRVTWADLENPARLAALIREVLYARAA